MRTDWPVNASWYRSLCSSRGSSKDCPCKNDKAPPLLFLRGPGVYIISKDVFFLMQANIRVKIEIAFGGAMYFPGLHKLFDVLIS